MSLLHRNLRLMSAAAGAMVVVAFAARVHAFPFYRDAFREQYPAFRFVPNDEGCRVCHKSVFGGGPRNPYGVTIAEANFDFVSIEHLDSDGDGRTNIQEINANTYPGRPDTIYVASAILSRQPKPVDADINGTEIPLVDAADLVESWLRDTEETTPTLRFAQPVSRFDLPDTWNRCSLAPK